MLLLSLATASLAALPQGRLVRVDDPDYPGAVARSATGSVLTEPPPPGTPWRWESIPETDRWPAVEALEATHVVPWHRAGATGAGVRIAIFDIGWYGPDADLSEVGQYEALDCWAHRSCEVPLDVDEPGEGAESGVHGIACAEVVRDLAPDVELTLLRVNSFTALENAVAWSVRNGIDIVSMSMSYYNDSFYDGGGPFHQPLVDLEANDVLMVTSSGNNADAHWFGPWRDADQDGRHDFDGSNGLRVYAREGERSLYVNWNQHSRCGDTDLDVLVFDEDRTVLAGGARDEQLPDGDRCDPVEKVAFHAAHEGWYDIEVHHRRGSLAGLDLDILGRGGTTFLHNMPERSVADPAAHPFAFAVGAVRAVDYLDADIEGFSSRGPNHALDPKPDIAGPNGLTTHAYGPEGFYGTSASTPAVAALIAVLMSDDPSLTPREAAWELQAMAIGEGLFYERDDTRFGAGKARLARRHLRDLPCGERPLVLFAFPGLALALFRRRRFVPPQRALVVAPSRQEDPCPPASRPSSLP